MARLTHNVSGVTVDVDDALVERLGSEWAPAASRDSKPAGTDAKTTARKGSTRKSD